MSRKTKKRVAAIAIDLGGTDLKSGVIEASGRILHQQTVPSGSKLGRQNVLKRILLAIDQEKAWAKQKGYRLLGVGLGVPGIISYPEGIVHRSPHFPDWKDYSLKTLLKKRLQLPFIIDNDANMAALGEGWKGAGRGKKNFVLLTLGTGIGGGIVLDGKIHHGDSGFAGELGHLVIERNGRACNCGGRGCLEMYASGTGLLKEDKQFTPEHLYHLALHGNPTAKKIWNNFGKSLGAGIASIVNILDIETVILGGGLSGAWKVFFPSLRKSLSEHIYPTTAGRIRIRPALLKNKAGLIGSAQAVFANI